MMLIKKDKDGWFRIGKYSFLAKAVIKLGKNYHIFKKWSITRMTLLPRGYAAKGWGWVFDNKLQKWV